MHQRWGSKNEKYGFSEECPCGRACAVKPFDQRLNKKRLFEFHVREKESFDNFKVLSTDLEKKKNVLGQQSTFEGFERLMGAMNIRWSLMPLHSEFEVFIWAMENMITIQQLQVRFTAYLSDLVKLVS